MQVFVVEFKKLVDLGENWKLSDLGRSDLASTVEINGRRYRPVLSLEEVADGESFDCDSQEQALSTEGEAVWRVPVSRIEIREAVPAEFVGKPIGKGSGPFPDRYRPEVLDQVRVEVTALKRRLSAIALNLDASIELQEKVRLEAIEQEAVDYFDSFIDDAGRVCCWVDQDFVDQQKEEYLSFMERYIKPSYRQEFYFAYYATIWSYLEQALERTCLYIRPSSTDIGVRDLYGRGDLDRYKLFIEKVVGVDLGREEWREVFHFRQVRNKVVHEGGDISGLREGSRRKLQKYCNENWTGILYVRDNRLRFGEEFCLRLCDRIITLVESVFTVWARSLG